MFLFGHLGIGRQLAKPFAKKLPLLWLMVGTLLPDLIDKPLYYLLVLLTGKRGVDIGLISSSQTVGHTGIFLLGLLLFAFLRKSRVAAAIGLGVATHLFLDNFFEHIYSVDQSQLPSSLMALLFPVFGVKFSVMPYSDFSQHLASSTKAHILWGEIVGLALLFLQWRKEKHGFRTKGKRRTQTTLE